MNFRTTVVLLCLLVLAGLSVFLMRSGGNGAAPVVSTGTTEQPKRLFEISGGDIINLSVKPAAGPGYSLERRNFAWNLTVPVSGPADTTKVNDMAEAVASLSSVGQAPAGQVGSTGVDPARYVIEFTTRDGKKHSLDVGDRTGVGGGDYVRVAGQDAVQITSADLIDAISKPPASLRRTQLFELSVPDVHSIRIEHGKDVMTLVREGAGWKMSAPAAQPVEDGAATDMVTAITGLAASGYKTADADDAIAGKGPNAPFYRLNDPVLTVTFAAQPPPVEATTTPTTRPDVSTTLRFGGYTDVTQKDVYCAISGNPTVVTVAAGVLDSFKKTPLEMRDLRVLTADPARVESVTFQTLKTAAQAAKTMTIERRPQARPVMGPVAAPKATTKPSSAPATQPQSAWVLAGKKPVDADDTRVEQLLGMFNPLRATRYLEPTTRPVATTQPGTGKYVLRLALRQPANKPAIEMQITEGGADQPIRARYNGQEFEVSRDVLDQLKSDFSATAKPTNAPELSPSSFAPSR